MFIIYHEAPRLLCRILRFCCIAGFFLFGYDFFRNDSAVGHTLFADADATAWLCDACAVGVIVCHFGNRCLAVFLHSVYTVGIVGGFTSSNG